MEQQDDWQPPSAVLQRRDGVWSPGAISEISYPDDGNEVCFQVEESSYWFKHRNDCIVELVRRHQPGGTIYDIGGGNGFVSKALQDAGWEVALVEPGSGAENARRRGVERVVRATLEDALFEPGSFPAACAFDVIEHIEDDLSFLEEIHNLLEPGGMLYLTVPAYEWLWSQEDINAGHFRRYDLERLESVLGEAGFEPTYSSAFFGWLVSPLFLVRSLPYRFGGKKEKGAETLLDTKSSHSLPPALGVITERLHRRERHMLRDGIAKKTGTSLICTARKPA